MSLIQKKAVLFVGGSQDHLPFIDAAQQLGFYTIVFDLDSTCKGGVAADYFFRISTHDLTGILSLSRKLSLEFCICGVMTYSSADQAIINAATLAKLNGLPHCNLKSIELTNDKELTRNRLIEHKIPTTQGKTLENIDEALRYFEENLNSMLVIKPSLGGQGSRGVNLIKTESDIYRFYDEASTNSNDSKVILERYVDGQEYSIDGIVVGDQPYVFSISKKYNLGSEANYIMSGFTTLSKNEQSDLGKEIKDLSIKVVKALGISNSFFSIDVIGSENSLVVIECGLLLDCKIDRLLAYQNFSIYESFLLVITGEAIKLPEPKLLEQVSLNFLHAKDKGFLKIQLDKVQDFDGLVEWGKADGSAVVKPKSIADVLGWAVTKNQSKKNLELLDELFSVT